MKVFYKAKQSCRVCVSFAESNKRHILHSGYMKTFSKASEK